MPSRYPSPFLYPILDLDYCNAKNRDPVAVVDYWMQHKDLIPFIQIRGKNRQESEINVWLDAIVEKYPFLTIIINDFWELAIKSDTGFHIGKEDFLNLSQKEKDMVRKSRVIKGTSCHSLEDVKNLESIWHYSGFGPIFKTYSKASENQPTGLGLLQQALQISRIPLVAIGGITPLQYADLMENTPVTIAGISSMIEETEFAQLVKILRTSHNENEAE